ncbi:hypothetical protein [Streptomyces sp. SM12]|uniref:hypothetical protein n=1 Tax=Streptomyces sp. SM12 TaxID=1071602 RepID=UPI0011B09525|nr:hypothetical protein [Streptomyces sp. SM12]
MPVREAKTICGDPRTSSRSYMLSWSDEPGVEGADWAWVPDNGRLDQVLSDLNITPHREWNASPDDVPAA